MNNTLSQRSAHAHRYRGAWRATRRKHHAGNCVRIFQVAQTDRRRRLHTSTASACGCLTRLLHRQHTVDGRQPLGRLLRLLETQQVIRLHRRVCELQHVGHLLIGALADVERDREATDGEQRERFVVMLLAHNSVQVCENGARLLPPMREHHTVCEHPITGHLSKRPNGKSSTQHTTTIRS